MRSAGVDRGRGSDAVGADTEVVVAACPPRPQHDSEPAGACRNRHRLSLRELGRLDRFERAAGCAGLYESVRQVPEVVLASAGTISSPRSFAASVAARANPPSDVAARWRSSASAGVHMEGGHPRLNPHPIPREGSRRAAASPLDQARFDRLVELSISSLRRSRTCARDPRPRFGWNPIARCSPSCAHARRTFDTSRRRRQASRVRSTRELPHSTACWPTRACDRQSLTRLSAHVLAIAARPHATAGAY